MKINENYTNEVPNGNDFYAIKLKGVIEAMEAKGITDINLNCEYEGVGDWNGDNFHTIDTITIDGNLNGVDVEFVFNGECQLYDTSEAGLEVGLSHDKAAGNVEKDADEQSLVDDKMDEYNTKYSEMDDVPRYLCSLLMWGKFTVSYDYEEVFEFTDMPFASDEDFPIWGALEFINEGGLDKAIMDANVA